MNLVTIRAATRADLAAIGQIQGHSNWRPEDYLAFDCKVALDGDRIAGFVTTRETCPGEREILYVAVDPAYRRTGIARSLLQNELSRAPGTWFLEVRESNTPAIKLYVSLGFREIGRRDHYYSAPDETAIVMRFFS
jgi:ribosomal-protein-alanine N-acetyltransferase